MSRNAHVNVQTHTNGYMHAHVQTRKSFDAVHINLESGQQERASKRERESLCMQENDKIREGEKERERERERERKKVCVYV